MSLERRYEMLAACAYARRFAEGMKAAVLGEHAGAGAEALTGAASVVAVEDEARVAAARTSDAPGGGFGLVVALGVERGVEEVSRAARRLLAPQGVLVLVARTGASRLHEPATPGAPAAEVEEALRRDFPNVRLYGLGAAAGAVVSNGGTASDATVEGLRGDAPFRAGGARCVLAVCGDAEPPVADGPLLFLDGDGLAYEELEAVSDEAGLLRDEVLRMQESEAQAFADTLALRTSEVNHFRSRAEQAERRLEERERVLTKRAEDLAGQLREIQLSRSWRAMGLYRRLAQKLGRG